MPPTTDTQDADNDFQTAVSAFHAAEHALLRLAERRAFEVCAAHFPTAHQIVVNGEWNEDGAMRVRLARILDDTGAVLYDVDEPTEDFEEKAEEVDDYLMWLEYENDDWADENTIDKPETT